ncbi:hypothetical protein [Paenibacillus apis]|uniref:Uncharacterized protein n=1 Tax=Paenibacillus apis TaxID=1792174 RepID=A0A919Y0B7_9BACL|nr:hypothetical protein [Paenibacillus apis]GIO42287.1 hypothetical protein J41TS4_20450 [Paenibacillus apis]
MYTYIAKAIKVNREIILTLKDNSKIAGLPSWGQDHSRIKIKSDERTIWIPLNEIVHVTTILNFCTTSDTYATKEASN